MAIRVVRLGSARTREEGIRLGTVRLPPRGVPRAAYASGDWYDVWLPNLAPSLETMKLGRTAATPREVEAFQRRYRTEMSRPENAHILALLAALSHHCNFSVGCYCEDEARCHRAVLRALLIEKGARMASD